MSISFTILLLLYDHDYKGIQKKVMEMGVPHQTLIFGLIHSYIEGDLKMESAKVWKWPRSECGS